MPYKTFVIHNMRAVGMHHWGNYKLIVGGLYSLQWEPECEYDLGNAMALYRNGVKRAYLIRKDAAIMSHIWSKDLPVNHVMLCIPQTEAHCVCHDLGPQHECSVKFRCNVDNISRAKQLLDAYKCNYSLT